VAGSRTENGSIHAARGQTRIPNIAEAKFLIDQALTAGWGDRDGDAMKATAVELEKRGYAVTFTAGYVGTPNRESAMHARPTGEELELMRIIHEWS